MKERVQATLIELSEQTCPHVGVYELHVPSSESSSLLADRGAVAGGCAYALGIESSNEIAGVELNGSSISEAMPLSCVPPPSKLGALAAEAPGAPSVPA